MSRKTSLDVVVPPPNFHSMKSFTHQQQTNQQSNDSQNSENLLNLLDNNLTTTNKSTTNQFNTNSLTTSNQSNAINISTNPLAKLNDFKQQNQLQSNQFSSSINNNYYGLNCNNNYYTLPTPSSSYLNNSSLNSLNSSPIHNLPPLSHSSSFPNFNQLQNLPNSNSNAFNNNPNLSKLNNPNIDNFKYQQLVLSKLDILSKTNNLKKLSNDNLIDLGQRDELELSHQDSQTSVLNLFDPLSSISIEEEKERTNTITSTQAEQSNEIIYSTIRQTSDLGNKRCELTESMKSIKLKGEKFTEENFYESINYERTSSSSSFQDNNQLALVKKEIVFNNNQDYLKHRNLVANEEIVNFKRKLIKLRSKYKASDKKTNPGFVISSRLNSPKDTCLSVKLVINSHFAQPVCFTCNVNTSIEHVICHVVCSIFDSSTLDFNKFILKVFGLDEYLVNDSSLGDYVYVNDCHKFDKDVKLTLIDRSICKIDYYSRTPEDDEKVENLNEYDVLPNLLLCKYNEITYDNVKILLNIIDIEAEKLLTNDLKPIAIEYYDTGRHIGKKPETAQSLILSVRQSVKALCSHLNFETTQLIESIENLQRLYEACQLYKQNSQMNDDKLNHTIKVVSPEIIGMMFDF